MTGPNIFDGPKTEVIGTRAQGSRVKFARRWFLLCAAIIGFGGVICYGLWHWTAKIPSLTQDNIQVAVPLADHLPFYFWDYGMWIDPKKFAAHELVLPYAKGPPQKFISQIIFQNLKTQRNSLALHGKRPRIYHEEQIHELFKENSLFHKIRHYFLIFTLMKEAFIESFEDATTQLTLSTFNDPTGAQTQLIGHAWNVASTTRRFFYWGPEGSVFPVECASAIDAPCAFINELESVRFPRDIKASLPERKSWTQTRIRERLEALIHSQTVSDAPERLQDETILTFYLASLLTIDPRDPEAYFHLGKLTHNKTTLEAALRYGRDVGLEPALAAELQSRLDSF